ncbi:MAG: glycosyltransferase family 39 protein [Anaerolineae bacterium]|nr:glycosyltransferase family 39 protein [Anaerolineae bacterium]
MRPKISAYNPRFATNSVMLITALALALNLHGLAADSFWGDEIFTASFASLSPLEIIRWTASDIHPPLYYLISGSFTKFSLSLGPGSGPNVATDWLWRFPSVMATVLAIPISYNLARRFTRYTAPRSRFTDRQSWLIGVVAVLLLGLAPIVVKYGQEARMHALFMLLSALSTWLFFRALDRPRHWMRWLVLALVTAANLYTMYFGFIILLSQAGFLLFSSLDPRDKPPLSAPVPALALAKARLVGFAVSVILAFLLYLPWSTVLYRILLKRATFGAIEGGVGAPSGFILGVVNALGPAPGMTAWGFLLLFLMGLAFLTRHYWPLAIFGGLWLVLPLVVPIVLGDPRALQFRYAFVLPIYLTIVAYAVVSLGLLRQQAGRSIRPGPVSGYLTWLLVTISFIALLDFYSQVKPNWRDAARYLDEHVLPADIILIGPLWDEGRFISYYYRGRAQLLTPAAMVNNIEGRANGLRAGGGRIWAVNRFAPAGSAAARNIDFSGVVISEPQVTVYEPEPLTAAAIDLAAQAVGAAYPWAAAAEAEGVLNPDPRTARAAALRAWGDALMAAGRPEEALVPYQTAVDIFPGWINGFLALAEAHEAAGNVPEAVEAYRQAVAFNLKWQGLAAAEATRLIEAGDWSGALEKYHGIVYE